MKSLMITITENNNTFSGKKELYNFCIVKNGNPDSIEQNIFDMIKDMNKRGYLDIIKFNNLFKYDNSLISLSNIRENLKPSIINLSDNLEFIKNKVFSSKDINEASNTKNTAIEDADRIKRGVTYVESI